MEKAGFNITLERSVMMAADHKLYYIFCVFLGKLFLIDNSGFVCLFDWILYIPSTNFQLNRNGSSWVEPVLI